MSTSYYGMREPITSVTLEEGPTHDRVTVFERHAHAGTLVVTRGSGVAVCRMFASADYGDPPMRTHWGGRERGCVVTENSPVPLDPDACLVSEYGEPITVREVRARAGHGRDAQDPRAIGELFGYGPRAVPSGWPAGGGDDD